jgi:hypothetical protein
MSLPRWRAILLATTVAGVGPAAARTGREVIAASEARHGFATWRDRTCQVRADRRGAGEERVREGTAVELSDARGEHRSLVELTAPGDVAGRLTLRIAPRAQIDQQWVWSPATRRAIRVAGGVRDESVDLPYRDLELVTRILQWTDDEAAATLTAGAALDGESCDVVMLVPKGGAADEYPYARYRLWFTTDDLRLRQVEAEGADGGPSLRVRLRRMERVQDHATPIETEVTHGAGEGHTVLRLRAVRYDTGVSADALSVTAIQQGR